MSTRVLQFCVRERGQICLAVGFFFFFLNQRGPLTSHNGIVEDVKEG